MQNIEKDSVKDNIDDTESAWMQLITDPVERRKVIYSAGALIAQQINGIQWFYYFGTIFSKAIGLRDPFLMTLIVFIIQVFVVLAAVLLANKIPRRPLLMITTGIMTVSIFVVGCLGIPGGQPSETIGKVIISFVIIEIVAFNFAWGPLGWTIVSISLLYRCFPNTLSRLLKWRLEETATRSTPSPWLRSGLQSGPQSLLCRTCTTLRTSVPRRVLCTQGYVSSR
jgi:hypothetical protein